MFNGICTYMQSTIAFYNTKHLNDQWGFIFLYRFIHSNGLGKEMVAEFLVIYIININNLRGES